MKKSENNNRLAVLHARYEKLIELNRKNKYTIMVLTKNGLEKHPKLDKYQKLHLDIYREKVGLWMFNRRENEQISFYKKQLESAKELKAVSMQNYNIATRLESEAKYKTTVTV